MFNFKHLKEMKQNWWKHGTNALSNLPKAIGACLFSFVMCFVIVIHSVFPFVFANTIGRWLKYLHKL